VYKVEPPEGDQLRTWGTIAPDGTGWWFKSHNRNKRLLTFNLRDAKDAEIVRQIALRCDVVVENFRPGWLRAIGLGESELRTEKPELIYISISGYGQTGVLSQRPGYGSIAEAMGGFRYITGELSGPPMRIGISIADEIAGLHCVIGALAALYARRGDGRGESVDISLVDSVLSLMEGALPEYGQAGVIANRTGNLLATSAPTNVYPTRDGEWFAIGANGQSIFRRFAQLMGTPELAGDERFATNQARIANVAVLDDIIAAWTKRRTSQELDDELGAAAIPGGPVLSIEGIVRHPHFLSRNSFVEIPDGEGNMVTTCAPVPRLKEHPDAMRQAAGAIGRDQRESLQELGIELEAIA
jgi:crotonobetainyl-CoA:carnitine CoA-transferase CaiB-like acyl-CoA transferase